MADIVKREETEQNIVLRKAIVPQSIPDMQEYYREVVIFKDKFLQEGIDGDYAKIPGCPKESLLLPGAEKYAIKYRIYPKVRYDIEKLDDFHRVYTTVISMFDENGYFVGEGIGVASTLESKHRYRTGETEVTDKVVPKEYWKDRDINLIGGKGFVTKKVDGQWFIARQGKRVENENPADQYNTVASVSFKRAYVKCVRGSLGLSNLFTQDIDEDPEQYGYTSPDPKTETKVKEEFDKIIKDAEFTEEVPDYLKEPVPDEAQSAKPEAPALPTEIDSDEAIRIKLWGILQSRNAGTEPYPQLCADAKKDLKEFSTYKEFKPIDRLDWLKEARLRTVYGKAKDKYPAPKEDALFPIPKLKSEPMVYGDNAELPL